MTSRAASPAVSRPEDPDKPRIEPEATTSRAASPAVPCPPLSVAPMMDRTDRHFRRLLRLVSERVLLYTEMMTTQAILRGPAEALLAYDPVEHPLALQLGGDDPRDLAACARLAEDLGYDEVNLNCGCPSDRVQSGRFGAVLMKTPEVVAEAVAAMKAAVRIPVTVKQRIGVDELDGYEDMLRFVDVVASAGADRFTVHARKAWLKGLSPKENRSVPPLRYEDVYRLARARPGLAVELNGGVRDLDAAAAHLERVAGVMIGRAAYDDPFMLEAVDARFFGAPRRAPLDRVAIARAMIPYIEREAATRGTRPHAVLRHMLGLFAGLRGGRAYRRVLSTEGPRAESGGAVLARALDAFEAAAQGGERTRKPPSTSSERARVVS
jgi:tRNA-dihydrouridine synthase A